MKRNKRVFFLGVAAVLAAAAFLFQRGSVETPAAPTLVPLPGDLADIPNEQRAAARGGDPRTPGYWLLWNSCAEENRADVAEANGGRAAGWYLMDDLLADPGIQLGDYPVLTCEEGLAILRPSDVGDEGTGLIFDLAKQLLTAELNLSLGAETCAIAEEVVLGAHIILSEAGFTGSVEDGVTVPSDIEGNISQLVDVLAIYNNGNLCVALDN